MARGRFRRGHRRAGPSARVLLATCLVVASAGCVSGASASIEVDVDSSGLEQDSRSSTADCPDQARLHIDIARIEGELDVRVLDGGGKVVFEESYRKDPDQPEDNVAGETVRGLFGEAGQWTLSATYRVTDLHLKATLSCD